MFKKFGLKMNMILKIVYCHIEKRLARKNHNKDNRWIYNIFFCILVLRRIPRMPATPLGRDHICFLKRNFFLNVLALLMRTSKTNGGCVLKRSFCVLSQEEYIDVHEKKKNRKRVPCFAGKCNHGLIGFVE